MAKSHIVGHRVLAKNLAANWVGVSVDVLIAFFLTPFIVSQLGIAVYGVWSLLNSLVSYMGLIDMGVRGSVGRFINHYLAREDDARTSEVVSSSVIFLTLASLVMFGVAIVLGENFTTLFPKTPAAIESQIALALPIMAVTVWATFIGAVYRSVLAALDRFELVNAIMIVSQGIRAAAVVYVLLAGQGIVGLALVSLALACVNMLTFAVVASRLCKSVPLIRLRWSRERFLEIWRFGVVAFLTRSASQLIYQSDQIVVMLLIGPTAVGIYSIASMLIQYAQRFVDQVGGTLYPSIMRSGSLKDHDGLRTLYLRKAKISFLIGILLYAGFGGFGSDFIRLWLGDDFRGAVAVLLILSAAEIAGLMSSCGGSILFSLDKLRFNLLAALGEAILNLVLSVGFVLLTPLRLEGVALGTFVAAVLVRGVLHPYYTCRAIGLSYAKYSASIIWPAVATFVITVVGFRLIEALLTVTGWYTLLAAAGVASLAYLLLAKKVFFPQLRLLEHVGGHGR